MSPLTQDDIRFRSWTAWVSAALLTWSITLLAPLNASALLDDPPAASPTTQPPDAKPDHDHDHDDDDHDHDAKTKGRKPSSIRRPAHRHTGKTYMGREIADVMSYLGAPWLFRPERIAEERPDEMLAALNIKPGMVVADVGAGAGFHTLRLARLVGPTGTVIATDVQPQMIQLLRNNVRQARLTNVKPVVCTHDDAKLPKGAVDLVLMVDVYHEAANPEALLKDIKAALKPDGRLVLVEFRAEDPNVPIKEEHKMTVAQMRKEIEPQGFRLAEKLDFLPWQHILIFENLANPPASTGVPKTDGDGRVPSDNSGSGRRRN